jgi:hypothetical protein
MFFYRYVALSINSYLWSEILWNIGGDGYDWFNKKKKVFFLVRIFQESDSNSLKNISLIVHLVEACDNTNISVQQVLMCGREFLMK